MPVRWNVVFGVIIADITNNRSMGAPVGVNLLDLVYPEL
jgi:hypothetical protein